MDLEEAFSALESKVQLLVMRYTQVNEENKELLSRIKHLEQELEKQNNTLEKLTEDNRHYELIKQHIMQKIEALISYLVSGESFDVQETTKENENLVKNQKNKLNNKMLEKDFQANILSQSTINFAPEED